MMLIFLFLLLISLDQIGSKDPSNFKNDHNQLKTNFNLSKNADSLINNETGLNRSTSRSIKIEKKLVSSENNEMRFFNFQTTSNNKLRNSPITNSGSVSNSRTSGDLFRDDLNEKNKLNKIKESRSKPALLASMIDSLNVINFINKTSQFNSSACDTSKCVLNCELQDQTTNNGSLLSGFCNNQKINLCQCCKLNHESCILTQRRCKSIGLKAICNRNNECSGNCTCTVNSCLQYCMNKQKLILSNVTSRANKFKSSNNDDGSIINDLFYTNSISASASCISGQCICNNNENTLESEDKPDYEINSDEKLNPIYEKMLLNNRRALLYDSLQISFSNMLRMFRLMINSIISPNTYGLNCDNGILKTISPSSDTFEKYPTPIDPKFFQLENSKFDNDKIKKEILMMSFTRNKTINFEKSSFLTVFENRFEVFRNQRNLVISKLIQLVQLERKANRKLLSKYLDDLRSILISNLYLNHERIEELSQTNIDDFESVFQLTLGFKNALQLVSINLT